MSPPLLPKPAWPAAVLISASKDMVAATVRTIFAQPDAATTRSQLRVVGLLAERFPKAAELLAAAEVHVCA